MSDVKLTPEEIEAFQKAANSCTYACEWGAAFAPALKVSNTQIVYGGTLYVLPIKGENMDQALTRANIAKIKVNKHFPFGHLYIEKGYDTRGMIFYSFFNFVSDEPQDEEAEEYYVLYEDEEEEEHFNDW